MREIKFRAWDGEKFQTSNCHFCGSKNYNSDYKVMQYTGLKDKNDKEIYEGDLLKITDTFHTYPMPVIWSEDCWTMEVEGTYGTLSEWNEAGEIIGNIYENPELIKKY